MSPDELLQLAIKNWKEREVVLDFDKEQVKETVETLKPTFEVTTEQIMGPHHKKHEQLLSKKQLTLDWQQMKPAPQTEENKRDYHVIRNRHVLDPKRHYKRIDKPTSVYQIGTIISGYNDKQAIKSKKSIVDELLSDQKTRQYLKKRTFEVEKKRNFVTRKGYKKKK